MFQSRKFRLTVCTAELPVRLDHQPLRDQRCSLCPQLCGVQHISPWEYGCSYRQYAWRKNIVLQFSTDSKISRMWNYTDWDIKAKIYLFLVQSFENFVQSSSALLQVLVSLSQTCYFALDGKQFITCSHDSSFVGKSTVVSPTCASVTLSFRRRPSFSSTADSNDALICSLDIVAFLPGVFSVGENAP